MPRVTELYAWVVADSDPDDEGIPAFLNPEGGMWMPMMGADVERAESLRPMAVQIAHDLGRPVRLVRSIGLVDVDEVLP
jgi:hypothetical protein